MEVNRLEPLNEINIVINSGEPFALVVAEEEGYIREWNRQAELIFGWKREQVIGKRLTDTIIPQACWDNQISKIPENLGNSLEPAFSHQLEIKSRRSSGREFNAELTIVPSSVGEEDLLSFIARDIDVKSNTETVLHAINDLARNLLGKSTLEEIAWEITEKVTQLIGLEDCVIYILDDESRMLRHIAAYGEKNPHGSDIKNIRELKVGEGVAGKAAEGREPVMVDDCSKFEGYIYDDYSGMSELAVPIIDGGVVLGVIDSKHVKKGFFSANHLEILTKIASLSAAQIRVAIETQRRIRAKNSLKESEERWQHLVENQPIALQITKNGKIEYLNPAGLHLYEADTMEQMQGFDLYKFVSEDVKERLISQYESLKRGGVAGAIEYPITTLMGNERIIKASSTAVQTESETVIHTILRDITDKKSAENDSKNLSRLLSTLINNINSGILMEMPNRRIMHTNEMFCELFGNQFAPEDIIGQDCGAMLEPASQMFEDTKAFSTQTNEVFEKSIPSLNEEWNTVDGRVFERDFIPIWHEGKYLGSAWQYRDITEKKKVEQKLRQALETERNYNELNKNLVSMVSHEFRTPLTSINSTAELLLQYGERFKGEDLKKRVRRIYSSAQKMDSLIQDVLTLGKLESNNTSFDNQEFSFSESIQGLIKVLRLTILKDREIVVQSETEMDRLYLDQNMIELILRNLLENAGKYSSVPDKIILNYSVSETEFKLSCQDFGIGIPEEDCDIVFESFVRGTNTQDIKGTGLGLPIVKKLVERMSGDITLESKVGYGTSVSIILPVNRNN